MASRAEAEPFDTTRAQPGHKGREIERGEGVGRSSGSAPRPPGPRARPSMKRTRGEGAYGAFSPLVVQTQAPPTAKRTEDWQSACTGLEQGLEYEG